MPKIILNTKGPGSHMVWNKHTRATIFHLQVPGFGLFGSECPAAAASEC